MALMPTKLEVATQFGVDVRLLLDLRETMALTGLAHRTIRAWMNDGRFPLPRRVGDRLPKWYRPDLLAWMEALPTTAEQLTPTGQLPRPWAAKPGAGRRKASTQTMEAPVTATA